MVALTATELLGWLDDTARHWAELLRAHPEALALPCDVRESQTAGQLLQHIVAVELRYAERLAEQPETAYEQIAYGSVEVLEGTHTRAMAWLQPLLSRDDGFWEEAILFTTRSMGAMRATRRAVLVHLAMHSIRHYAQLATLVRQHGIRPDWPMDYLFQSAERV